MQRTLSPALTEAIETCHTATRARTEQLERMQRDLRNGVESSSETQDHFCRLDSVARRARQQAFDMFAREHLDVG